MFLGLHHNLKRKKQQDYNKARRTKQLSDWAEYKSAQGQVRQTIRTEHQKHNCKGYVILMEISHLALHKSHKKDQIGINSLQTSDGLATTPAEKLKS